MVEPAIGGDIKKINVAKKDSKLLITMIAYVTKGHGT